jgi:hypothetical protein
MYISSMFLITRENGDLADGGREVLIGFVGGVSTANIPVPEPNN